MVLPGHHSVLYLHHNQDRHKDRHHTNFWFDIMHHVTCFASPGVHLTRRSASCHIITPTGHQQQQHGGHNKRIEPANCLKCASRDLSQLFLPNGLIPQQHSLQHVEGLCSRLPATQQQQQLQLQQQRGHPEPDVEQLLLWRLEAFGAQQQLQQQPIWQPAWAAVSSSSSSGAGCDNNSRNSTCNSIQQQLSVMHSEATGDEAPGSCSQSGSASSSSSSSSCGNSPAVQGMPSLSNLLGDAAAGSNATVPGSSDGSSRALGLSDDPKQEQQEGMAEGDASEPGVDSPGVRAALAMLKWYKSMLSPMMASTCRFLPTCSQYSMDSYRAYGVSKGTVLTAWRLLRCNPWGGSGYDPTTWPPPGLGWLFQFQGSAEVAVVVGAYAVVRFMHALLFE